MDQVAIAMSPGAAVGAYRRTQTDYASPLDLVVMAYDLAIRSARNGDTRQFLRVTRALKDSLDANHGTDSQMLAGRLLAIYIYCESLVAKGKGAEAATMLEELRDAWQQVSRRVGTGK